MYIPAEEQETVIQFDRQRVTARVYTTDATMISKLDKKYKRHKEHKNDGRVVAVEYLINKGLINWRKTLPRDTKTAEQKKALSERMRKIRATKK